jgi:hypothetical protein
VVRKSDRGAALNTIRDSPKESSFHLKRKQATERSDFANGTDRPASTLSLPGKPLKELQIMQQIHA